ncbi:MAG TPA: tRNA (guanosine(46)-N7)-methyltransferase TrmB [Gammaproteobacteria bacterium]|nr:tRNA (guanosine(46)-N7)-methyltransferase TrmB [Gammaproteobacteria bacterium]
MQRKTRIRSFVHRNSRITPGQAQARSRLWPRFGLDWRAGLLDLNQVFNRQAPRFLEIGFGSGQSLALLAQAHPEWDFIGVETHRPGIGALLLAVEQQGLTNVRVYEGDVIDVLSQSIPDHSLAGVQIFFPDPWPKRRHHVRRLIQVEFVQLITQKLLAHGILHLATDWQDYAMHMAEVLSQVPILSNLAAATVFADDRSTFRPLITKFERRAQREGRAVWELQYRLDNIQMLA